MSAKGETVHQEGIRRWRLILGKSAEEQGNTQKLNKADKAKDEALGAIYDGKKRGDLSGSQPNINKWLGDIRQYFPESAALIMQKDAVEKLGIEKFLESPDVLDAVVPDVQLAYTLLSLKDAIPDHVKGTARMVIERLAKGLEQQLKMPVQLAANKGIQRYQRKLHRNNKLLDWPRTIQYNLKNYNASEKRIIPEKVFGFNARKRSLRELYILLDQSGSMSSSLVYTGIIASILYKLPAIETHLILFDSQVVDMTDLLHDPVELLFGVQMGGGTDVIRALRYCRQKIRKPRESIVFVVSDLYDNAPDRYLLEEFLKQREDGIRFLVLPALSDNGKADFNQALAAQLSDHDIRTLACTPDKFCDLLPDVLSS